ncbi:LPS-assembly protein LptD [Novipirellula artificiosorum]|uniref:LPS-assembly protein LptD n=1 Tax=Novipirellula artificiosorum TaxID=2528016 RepID=A0A5C6DJL6_9BACT|nr:LPS-assembly protein LptD [Novipirellula artificiosorum]
MTAEEFQPRVSPAPLRLSGNVIYRWDMGDAQASLLEGDCVLQHAGRQIIASSILVRVRGEIGNVHSEVVVEGIREDRSNGGKAPQTGPQRFTFVTMDDPEIQAPLYRGAPDRTPRLVQYLRAAVAKPTRLGSTGGSQLVTQAQYQAPQGPQVQPIEDPLQSWPAPTLDGMQAPPQTTNAPTALDDGMLSRSMPLPIVSSASPPITLSEEPRPAQPATPGKWQFYVNGGSRSIEILPRDPSSLPVFETDNRPERNETVVLARGGATVLVRDVSLQMPSGTGMDLGTISLSADRIVAWTPLATNWFNGGLGEVEGELYLEGDIVFRQGERIVYADSMYFNVSREIGIVLDAEAITTIPNYQGIVRLKADVLQQVSRGNFYAFDAAITSSRMGVPRYWLQSERLQLTDRNTVVRDPVSGTGTIQSDPFVSSTDNFVYFGGVPILYWPRFSTPLREPTFYISDIDIRNDSIFGNQILLDFNLLQVFGVENPPDGLKWELSTDYLSDRGPAIGTFLDYNFPGLFGIPGATNGFLDAWVIKDKGTDTLGGDRKDLPPEVTTRGRVLFEHRQQMPNDYEFIAEFGWISDRNFEEQFFEKEWDTEKNRDTALRLRKNYHSNLFELSGKFQVNDFFEETERLPALDHYLIGGSLLADWFTWSAHNHISYTRLNAADTATNPAEAATMTTLPGEMDTEGMIARTRQELAMPIQAGPVKVVPYVSGEAARYGQAADGNPLTRILGQGGIRATLPMVRVDPSIQSSLLNIRGLAHKMEWTADYFYADSNTDLDELPLYDPLNDHSQQQFMRRFTVSDYAGILPATLDPRIFALRQGIQKSIANGSDTVADDLQQVRLSLNQRWQTKRGLPGRERIVDLFSLDTDVLVFPDADRDNFGETVGPATYDMAYHIGDRVSLLSDGYFDFFDSGLRSYSAGIRTSRPGVGDIYFGLLSLEGPISSTVLRSVIDMRLNEKWIWSSGTTYDFGEAGNVGQSFALTRIGESLLVRLGFNVDSGRDNVGFGFTIEPRFWPSPRLGRIGGQLIPPPGVEGLE